MGGALIKGWAKAARKNEMPEGLEITVTAKTQKTLDKLRKDIPDPMTLLPPAFNLRQCKLIVSLLRLYEALNSLLAII